MHHSAYRHPYAHHFYRHRGFGRRMLVARLVKSSVKLGVFAAITVQSAIWIKAWWTRPAPGTAAVTEVPRE